MTFKHFYTVKPNELEPGDVLVCTVTLHVNAFGFRMYRCDWQPGHDEIPQGSRIYSNLDELAQSLFPVVLDADLKGDAS